MIENELKDREQTQQALRPAQATPVRRTNNVALSEAAVAQNQCMGVESSAWYLFEQLSPYDNNFPPSHPFAGDDAE